MLNFLNVWGEVEALEVEGEDGFEDVLLEQEVWLVLVLLTVSERELVSGILCAEGTATEE